LTLKLLHLVFLAYLLGGPQVAAASELKGPGRFCGYSPIIDLLPGERVVTIQGGIHGGTFRWEGPFGSLDVHGVGWAAPPESWTPNGVTSKGHARFKERWVSGRYEVVIWNRRNGAAYFLSKRHLTAQQLAAIDRVDLFEEGEVPKGCQLRTAFSWQ
jgi:hypothetical protein